MNEQLSGGMDGTMWKPREAKPMSFNTSDVILALAMLVSGFLYWNLIRIVSLGAGVSIFAVVLCVILMTYFRLNSMRQTRDSFTCLGIIALSAMNFFLFDSIELKALNFVFLTASVVYWICLSTNRRLDEKLSVYIIGDLMNQFIIVPFSNFLCCFVGLTRPLTKNKNGKGILSAIIGILIFLPVLVAVVKLLTEADAAFESLVNNLRFSISDGMFIYIQQIVLGLPVAFYLYGLVYGNKYKRNTDYITLETINKSASAFRFAPSITVNSALTALNVIYVVFFISQASYLFSAFVNSIPEAMTYAEYARRGFFELCSVAGINLMVLAIAHIITNRGKGELPRGADKIPKILKIETVALCLFTIMLISTALSKMTMYISSYGLTQLRVYTTWFMVLLLITFVIVAVRQFKSFNGSRIVIISFVIAFMIFLCYGNVDGMIAKYNIDRFREGTLQNVDVEALAQLSDAAVPYMFDLYIETKNEELKASIKSAIITAQEPGMLSDESDKTFRDFNLQKYKADKIRAAIN